MKLIIAGGTGFVATELIRQSLALSQITSLVVLSRKPITVPEHANAGKVKQVPMESYDKYPEDVRKELAGASGCIWTVAITPSKSKAYDFETVKNVCQTSTMAGIKAMTEAGPATPFRFVYMSGAASERDQTKKFTMLQEYLLMRGATETKVLDFAKEHAGKVEVIVTKPGLINSNQTLARSATSVLVQGVSLISNAIPNIRVEECAAAHLSSAIKGSDKDTLLNTDLETIGREALAEQKQTQ